VGRTLEELGLGADGARVVAVVRGGEGITEFEGGFALRVGDTLVLTGAHADMEEGVSAAPLSLATYCWSIAN